MIYIPGNHDEALRIYCGQRIGGVEFRHNDIHVSANGDRILVIHGDEFDVVIRYVKWLALLGDWAYLLAMAVNEAFNRVRRLFGFSYWSLSAYLKQKVKKAVNFVGDFETALVSEARRHAAQGIICGHIHLAAKHDLGGIIYMNCGDWVESATAIGETYDGEFEIIHWSKDHPANASPTTPPVSSTTAV